MSETTIRNQARRRGFAVRKSRDWKHVPHGYNFGEYMLVDASTNFCVLGDKYDATLDDISDYLARHDLCGS
jgi:hypothetical protein